MATRSSRRFKILISRVVRTVSIEERERERERGVRLSPLSIGFIYIYTVRGKRE